MKILITLFILLFIPIQVYSQISYGNILNVAYVRNYDGDTITVNIPQYPDIIGYKISIRVSGIDTPEIKGKCVKEKVLAIKSKIFVENVLINSDNIDLYNIKRGKYFRIVADVIVDGENLTKLLLDNNLGVEYDGGTKSKKWCK